MHSTFASISHRCLGIWCKNNQYFCCVKTKGVPECQTKPDLSSFSKNSLFQKLLFLLSTLGILIKALPPIRALPRENANIFIRALPLIRALPGKSQSLTVKIFYRQFKQKKGTKQNNNCHKY